MGEGGGGGSALLEEASKQAGQVVIYLNRCDVPIEDKVLGGAIWPHLQRRVRQRVRQLVPLGAQHCGDGKVGWHVLRTLTLPPPDPHPRSLGHTKTYRSQLPLASVHLGPAPGTLASQRQEGPQRRAPAPTRTCFCAHRAVLLAQVGAAVRAQGRTARLQRGQLGQRRRRVQVAHACG